jgi:hypothetical protein
MNQTDVSIIALFLIIMWLLYAILRNTVRESYCNCRSYKYNTGASASDETLGYVYGTKKSVRDYTSSCNIPDYLVGVI